MLVRQHESRREVEAMEQGRGIRRWNRGGSGARRWKRHRFSIKGRVYPAVIPLETKKVSGKVLLGITPPELHILDMFEDEEYERTTIDVFLKDSSEKLQAHTYVWANKADPTLYGEWDFEEWKLLHMESFLNMTKGFVEEMEISDSKTRVAMYESFYQGIDNKLSNP